MTHYPIVLIDDLRSFKDQKVTALVLRTEAEGLEWLRGLTPEDSIGQLWLDHDLGEDAEGNVTSIMSIVNLLEEQAFFDQAPTVAEVFIHTSNSVGGSSMKAALDRFFRTRKIYAGDHFIV